MIVAAFISPVRAGEIHEAVGGGNSDWVKTLLEADPSLLESKDDDGETPFLVAAQNGKTEIISYLMKRGANRRATDKFGWTALHWSAFYGHSYTTKLLLKAEGLLRKLHKKP